ncbi:hypothetical protein ACOSP6_04215 [Tenacibaculum sp. MEBiC06402]|uniref:hypothetical protein n=1 Tax=unclassified Tenacibaculum TaxID=2635139 RepID=UPI003B9AF927
MKIQHLDERVIDYKESIKTVVDKKKMWETETKKLIVDTLNEIVAQYDIGWIVQELNWINNNEAVNITFNSFPAELMDCTNQIPSYQFIQGGTLVFTESYSGDVYIFIMFPFVENLDNSSVELGFYTPQEITERLIIEKVDEFLKEMIKWEVPTYKKGLGFRSKES